MTSNDSCAYILGVCDYQNMWYHDFADYCLESITINRLIGDLDNSAANKTILRIITSAKSNVDAQRRLSFATVR